MRLLFAFCCTLLLFKAGATNLVVSNVSVTGRDTTAGTARVRFDISWEQSWRYGLNAGINNHDAAWVFVKYREGGVDYVSQPGATNFGSVITVNTTTGLRVGMPVWVSSGTGSFAAHTVVTNILSSTTFEINTTPSVDLASNAVVRAERPWQHAWLGNSGDHTAGSGTALTILSGLRQPGAAFNAASNPAMGAFFYRAAEGYGPVTATGNELLWHYRENGIDKDAVVEVQVYAVEMVYVPAGAFYVGDGSSSTLRGQLRNGSANQPLKIVSDSALTLGGTAAGNLANNNATGMSTADDFNDGTTQNLPAAFPKGYAAGYVMKYEISQGQYVDFLNALHRQQQAVRTAAILGPGTTSLTNRYVLSNSSSLQQRNGLRADATLPAHGRLTFYNDLNGNGTPNESADGQFIACNYLNWADVAAYLDWSALRPLSELDFEKAARGQLAAVANEYGWGSTMDTAASSISNAGANNEQAGNAAANAVYGNQGSVQGPLRTGVFARTASSRQQAGAAHWGITELSGNVWERAVTLGNADGRAFEGTHGDGLLTIGGSVAAGFGQANVSDWPGSDAIGQAWRGGSWQTTNTSLRLSDRHRAVNNDSTRSSEAGGRGMRTAGCAPPSGITVVTGNSIPQGGTATFTASGAGSAYWWLVPVGWEIVSGQGTDTVEIYANTPGVLRVAGLNDCGSGYETEVSVTVE